MITLEKSLTQTSELLVKASRGEGSRGGKVIGHTKSGQAIYDHLQSKGFKHEGTECKDSVRRYVKHGFYDGDFPNAHQTNVHEEHHKYKVHDPKKKRRKEFAKHLEGSKFRYAKHSKGTDMFNRGAQRIIMRHIGNYLHVNHYIETTKPDREFEASGRGIGQII